MSDLKKRLEDLNTRREEEQRRRSREEMDISFRKNEEDRQRREREGKELYTKRLAEHMSRFFCHICGTPSKGPYYDEGTYVSDEGSRNSSSGHLKGGGTNWLSPTGLRHCEMCQELTCGKCTINLEGEGNSWFARICTSCGESLLTMGISYPEWREKEKEKPKKGFFQRLFGT